MNRHRGLTAYLRSKRLALHAFLLVTLIIPLTSLAQSLTDWPMPVLTHLQAVRDNPQNVLDRTLPLLPAATDHIDRAGLHFVMSRAYAALILHEKALEQANQALLLLDRKTQPWLYAYAQLARADALKGLGKAREGETDLTAAKQWADHNETHELQAYALSVAGYLNLTLSETDKALANFQTGYRLAEQHDLRISPADFSGMIALVYEYRDEPSLAIPYFEQAEAYYRSANLRLELANTLFGLGRSKLKLNQRQEGLQLLVESARLAIDIHDIQGAAYSYQQISEALIERGKLTEAKAYLEDALTLFKEAGNPFQQIGVLLSQARIQLIEANNTEALERLNLASELAVGDAFLPYNIQINKLKAEALAARDNYEQAYSLILTMLEDEHRLQQEKNSQRLIKLKTAFETEQQRSQNALLKEQNLRQQTQLDREREQQKYTAVVVALLCIISVLLFWQYRIGQKHQRRLERLANHDGLTGLLTRRKTMEDVGQQLSLAHRHNEYMSLALLDLDHFKRINDTFGHQAGDDVLKGVAKLAAKTFRGTDILGRVGGEEFLFAFPHTPVEDAEAMLAKFAEAVKLIPDRISRPQIKISVSAGLVNGSFDEDPERLMALADEALYSAKEGGRDQIHVYHPTGQHGSL